MVLLILKFFVSTPGTAPPVFNVFFPKDDLRVLCSEQIYHKLGWVIQNAFHVNEALRVNLFKKISSRPHTF